MKRKLLIIAAVILAASAALGLRSLDWDWVRHEIPVFGFSIICPREEVLVSEPDAIGCANSPGGMWLGSASIRAINVTSGEAYVEKVNATIPDAKLLIIGHRQVEGLDAVVIIAPIDAGIYGFKYSEKTMYLVRSGKLYSVAARFGNATDDEKFLSNFKLGPDQP